MWPANQFRQQPPSADRQGNPFTAAELLEAPRAMPRPVKNISLTWSEVPQLPVQTPKHLLSNCALWIPVPTKPLFSKRTTVYMRQSAGERKGRISSQEPDNSWGRAGNGDLRKCGMLKCLSSSPHGIPRHPQLRMCIRTNTYILSLPRGFLKTGAKLGSENI